MKHKYGVIVWSGDNRYHVSQMVKTFAHEKAAQKYADKLNAEGGNYVVRTMAYCLA